MSTYLYYFSGTGNSLWICRQLALRLDGDFQLISLGTDYEMPAQDCNRIGIVFPVHMWGLPGRVVKFIRQLTLPSDCYFFALAVNAGQVAGTLLQLQKLLSARGIMLGSGFDIVMPSNYIIWNGAQPALKQQEVFAKAQQKLDRIASSVRIGHPGPVEKGPWWQNYLFAAVNIAASSRVPLLDKDFWVDENCIGCGTCVRVCPAANIRLDEGRPLWLHHCEQCLACLQWCPQEAVQYSKKTSGKKRYHHPEILLSDMLSTNKQPKNSTD